VYRSSHSLITEEVIELSEADMHVHEAVIREDTVVTEAGETIHLGEVCCAVGVVVVQWIEYWY